MHGNIAELDNNNNNNNNGIITKSIDASDGYKSYSYLYQLSFNWLVKHILKDLPKRKIFPTILTANMHS